MDLPSRLHTASNPISSGEQPVQTNTAFGRHVVAPGGLHRPQGTEGRAADTPALTVWQKKLQERLITQANGAQTAPSSQKLIEQTAQAWESAMAELSPNNDPTSLPAGYAVLLDGHQNLPAITFPKPNQTQQSYLRPDVITHHFSLFPEREQSILLESLKEMAENTALDSNTRWEAALGYCLYAENLDQQKALMSALIQSLEGLSNHQQTNALESLAHNNIGDCLIALASDANCRQLADLGEGLPQYPGVESFLSKLNERAHQLPPNANQNPFEAFGMETPNAINSEKSQLSLLFAKIGSIGVLQGLLPAKVALKASHTILNAPLHQIPADDPRRLKAQKNIDGRIYKILSDPFLGRAGGSNPQAPKVSKKIIPLLEGPSTPAKQYMLASILKNCEAVRHAEYPIRDPLHLDKLSQQEAKELFNVIGQQIPEEKNSEQADLRKEILSLLSQEMMGKSSLQRQWGPNAINAFWATENLKNRPDLHQAIEDFALSNKETAGKAGFRQNEGFSRALGEVLKSKSVEDRKILVQKMAQAAISQEMNIEHYYSLIRAFEHAKPDDKRSLSLDAITGGDIYTFRAAIRENIQDWPFSAQKNCLDRLAKWGTKLAFEPTPSISPSHSPTRETLEPTDSQEVRRTSQHPQEEAQSIDTENLHPLQNNQEGRYIFPSMENLDEEDLAGDTRIHPTKNSSRTLPPSSLGSTSTLNSPEAASKEPLNPLAKEENSQLNNPLTKKSNLFGRHSLNPPGNHYESVRIGSDAPDHEPTIPNIQISPLSSSSSGGPHKLLEASQALAKNLEALGQLLSPHEEAAKKIPHSISPELKETLQAVIHPLNDAQALIEPPLISLSNEEDLKPEPLQKLLVVAQDFAKANENVKQLLNEATHFSPSNLIENIDHAENTVQELVTHLKEASPKRPNTSAINSKERLINAAESAVYAESVALQSLQGLVKMAEDTQAPQNVKDLIAFWEKQKQLIKPL